MIIKKFHHSCILLEENNKRLLIDPGYFSFIDGDVTTADIGPVDAIVITHAHQDHYYPKALKEFRAMQSTPIITHEEIGTTLKNDEGISYERIEAGAVYTIAGFTIEAFSAPHEALPVDVPHNLAYRFNKTFLHAGDSLHVSTDARADILALPVAGPWMNINQGLDYARRLKPKVAIPIHDWITKPFMLDRIYQMSQGVLEREGIQFWALKKGEAYTSALH